MSARWRVTPGSSGSNAWASGSPKRLLKLEHGERAVGRQHQSGVQHTLERGALRRELADRRLEYLAPHPFEHPRRGDAHRQ